LSGWFCIMGWIQIWGIWSGRKWRWTKYCIRSGETWGKPIHGHPKNFFVCLVFWKGQLKMCKINILSSHVLRSTNPVIIGVCYRQTSYKISTPFMGYVNIPPPCSVCWQGDKYIFLICKSLTQINKNVLQMYVNGILD
jgi:hypothetical protein